MGSALVRGVLPIATNFPTTLDTLTSPSSSSQENVISHAGQHANANDAINALETKVGADSSAVTTTLDYKLKNASSVDPGHLHTSAGISGQLSVAKGGTGAATLTGLVKGNGTSAFTTTTAPTGTILGTTDTQALTNKTITDSTNNVMAKSLKSATTTVDVSAATAPSTNQVLMATSTTAATWQAAVNFNTTGVVADFATSSTTMVDVTNATLTIVPTKTVTVFAIFTCRVQSSTAVANIEVRLLIDGVSIQDLTVTPSAQPNAMALSLSGQASVASGSRVIKIQALTGNASDATNVLGGNLSLIWG